MYDVWCMMCDCMMHDAWCMLYDVWCMVYGVWCMVYDVWCMMRVCVYVRVWIGYLPGRIVFFLMNLEINKSPIYLTRHGESQYNVQGYVCVCVMYVYVCVCVWCAMCDVWCVVCDVWYMMCLWCVMCDVWCVMCDVWCMMYDVWCVYACVCMYDVGGLEAILHCLKAVKPMLNNLLSLLNEKVCVCVCVWCVMCGVCDVCMCDVCVWCVVYVWV